ncbi:hypothetical protein D1007_00665 [Hordeum vulgare]|nr:hypothetical protein D1007_00665 [Hordeum vulgare]
MIAAGDASTTGERQVGGRFWALANDVDDEPEDAVPDQRQVNSPTPSDLVCESLQLGYIEEEVAQNIACVIPSSDHAWSGLGDHNDDKIEVLRRIVHRRTAPSAIRPWKGPLPKVRLPALTLADFIDSWKAVRVRRKNNRAGSTVRLPATASSQSDLGIREKKDALFEFIDRPRWVIN